MRQGVSWRKIKAEYISGHISQRALAEKYGVPMTTLVKHAKKEKWTAKRKEAENKAVEKASEKTAELRRSKQDFFRNSPECLKRTRT